MTRARPRPPATAVIGAGRLAAALVPLLTRAGYPVVAVASRSRASLRRSIRFAPRARRTTLPEVAAIDAALVLLAVPDRAIAPVAARIAVRLGPKVRGKTFLHHAGALGVEPLIPLRRLGAHVGVLHPLQCLGLPRVAAEVLPGSWARVGGDRSAVARARRIARDLELRILPLPADLPARDLAAYHAAASLVANDLVALLSIGLRLFGEIGITQRTALSALVRLAAGSLAHAQAGGLAAALTGPVARADAATLAAHLESIVRASPAGAAAHRALSGELVRLARSLGRLSAADGRALSRKIGPLPRSGRSRHRGV